MYCMYVCIVCTVTPSPILPSIDNRIVSMLANCVHFMNEVAKGERDRERIISFLFFF